jgi:urease accessory protein
VSAAAGAAVLLLSDSRFPAGGHAHSGGVESAVTAGSVHNLASLETFLLGRLRTAGLVAAGLAAAACTRAACTRATCSWDLLDGEADARTPSPAQRSASRRQGRALLRAARVVWPDDAALAELAASVGVKPASATGVATAVRSPGRDGGAGTRGAGTRAAGTHGGGGGGASGGGIGVGGATAEFRGGPHHAVVLGVATAAAGCGAAEAARIAAYQSVAGPASAAVRLLALDPMLATAVLARLAPDIDHIAGRAAAAADGPLEELPCPSAPALDLLAEAHVRAEVRLFES